MMMLLTPRLKNNFFPLLLTYKAHTARFGESNDTRCHRRGWLIAPAAEVKTAAFLKISP